MSTTCSPQTHDVTAPRGHAGAPPAPVPPPVARRARRWTCADFSFCVRARARSCGI